WAGSPDLGEHGSSHDLHGLWTSTGPDQESLADLAVDVVEGLRPKRDLTIRLGPPSLDDGGMDRALERIESPRGRLDRPPARNSDLELPQGRVGDDMASGELGDVGVGPKRWSPAACRVRAPIPR